MQFKYLQSFLHCAQAGSFSKAAAGLYISQPALLWQIKAVEEELGCKLFLRSNRGVRLTPAGEAFLPYARELDALYHKAREAAREAEIALTALRVGLVSYVPSPILQRVCQEYKTRYPNAPLEIVDVPFFDRRRAVADGRLDVTESSDSRVLTELGLQYLPLDIAPPYCAVPPGHPLCGRARLTLQDLEGQRLGVSSEKQDRINDILSQAITAQGLHIELVEISYEKSPFAWSALLDCIAIMPRSMTRVCAPLVPIPLDCGAPLSMGLVFAPNPGPALSAFIRIAEDIYSA